MSAEDLVARLEKEADARALRVEQAAAAEIATFEAAAEQASARRHRLAVAARRVELRAALDRELGAARQRAMRSRLLARHALVARVLERARELLEAPDVAVSYAAVARARLEDALPFFAGREVVVRCRPELAAALGERPGVVVEAHPEMGLGIALASADGALEIDDTLPARLLRLRARVAIDVVAAIDASTEEASPAAPEPSR